VQLVGSIIKLYYDARPSECQIVTILSTVVPNFAAHRQVNRGAEYVMEHFVCP